MTRINLVPVEELSDQHLIAEYRELPRVIKQDINIKDAPERFTLGKGHMKWAKKHSLFTLNRYMQLCDEMEYRGFKVRYDSDKLYRIWLREGSPETDNFYNVDGYDMLISRKRLVEKYKEKPKFYKWTKRDKPGYYDRPLDFNITWRAVIEIIFLAALIMIAYMNWD